MVLQFSMFNSHSHSSYLLIAALVNDISSLYYDYFQIFMMALLFIVTTAVPSHNDETVVGELTDVDINNPEAIQHFFKLKKIKKLLLG